MSFEPFFDYEALSEEMAEDLRDALRQLRQAQEDLLSASDAEGLVSCARDVVEAQNEIMSVHREINHHIYTVPAMVHVAGKAKLEFSEGRPLYVQRCDRCGSELCRSRSEEEQNFTEGELVGKAQMEDGQAMYLVGNRDLEDHELRCVSFKEIFGIDN